MAITIKHAKTDSIADWTQADLDAQIAAGNFPPGTLLANIVLPSDWNNDHTVSGTIAIANGGTGQTTANAAINALLPSQTSQSGKVLSTNGTDTSWISSGGTGTVTSVTGTAPVSVATGTTTPVISMAAATTSVNGYLTSTDWNTFNSKGNGTVTSVALSAPSIFSVSGSPVTSSGTISLTYSGTALPVLNGGTGVTTSSGANSVVLRDANANITTNCLFEGFTSQAAGTLITLTASSVQNWNITGSGGQTIKLPNATTLPNGALFTFNNNQSSGTIIVQNNSSTTIDTLQSGAFSTVTLLDNSTAAGNWDRHNQTPSNVSWSTNTFDYPGSIISATWNGTAIALNRGGTNASLTAVNGGAVYSTGSALAISAAGTSGQVLTSSGAGAPTWTTPTTGTVTSVTGTAPVVSSGGNTPAISMPAASSTVNGYLTSTDWTTFNSKGSGTVTSVSATSPVTSTGGATPTIAMPAATTSVSGYLTSTDWNTFNNKGSGTVTSVAVTAPSIFSVAGSPITSSGTIALTYSGTALPILNGGTGQTTASAAFNALSPLTTAGDILYGATSGAGTRLGIGTAGQVLTVSIGGLPTWSTIGLGTGTVTSVSVVSANGFAGTVATATTTPAITLTTSITGVLKGNGTAISAATSGTDYSAGTSALATGILKSTTTTGALSIAVAADFPTLNQNTTGTAANVTGTVAVANGGSGRTTNTAYAVICGGTTTGGVEQSIASVGTTGQVLTSNGASALPTFQTISSTPTTAQVLTATAGASADAVGTYAWLVINTSNTSLDFDTNYAGSSLLPNGIFSGSATVATGGLQTTAGGTARSGTWKCMGQATSTTGVYARTLLLRVA